MKQIIRRTVLCLAALSPGAVALGMSGVTSGISVVAIALTGAVSVVVAVMAVTSNGSPHNTGTAETGRTYPSLLTGSAHRDLKNHDLETEALRVHLMTLTTPVDGARGFVTLDDQIAMVLAQIMAQWQITDVMVLDDDQLRELWLIERLMRSTPAEAGAMAEQFTTPNAMLAMRDRVANSAAA